MEVVKAGKPPKFKEITIPSKRVPVCHCGHERAECTDCGRGFLTVTLKGEVPKFKVVAAETTANAGTPGDVAEEGPTCDKITNLFLDVGFLKTVVDDFLETVTN